MPGVTAATVYDVLHDADYRKKWDPNVIETHDIARLTNNADVGYYSCKWMRPKRRTTPIPGVGQNEQV